ncbi:MAG: hypothetical protein ACRCWR_06170 [Saezia sp.]
MIEVVVSGSKFKVSSYEELVAKMAKISLVYNGDLRAIYDDAARRSAHVQPVPGQKSQLNPASLAKCKVTARDVLSGTVALGKITFGNHEKDMIKMNARYSVCLTCPKKINVEQACEPCGTAAKIVNELSAIRKTLKFPAGSEQYACAHCCCVINVKVLSIITEADKQKFETKGKDGTPAPESCWIRKAII